MPGVVFGSGALRGVASTKRAITRTASAQLPSAQVRGLSASDAGFLRSWSMTENALATSDVPAERKSETCRNASLHLS
jgi:hypothetical protein